MVARDQRAHRRRRIVGCADLQRFGLLLECRNEAFEDRLLDIHTFAAQTHLSGVGEARLDDTPPTAASKSASAKTTAAFLPPSSNEISFTPSATVFMIVLPVRDSPVKIAPR